MAGDRELERAAITLFDRWIEVPEEERTAWLDRETEGRADLRARLEALAAAARRGSLATGGAFDWIDEMPPPERLGAYRLIERIGAGGMGSVYRGERITGDFAHEAAIKIVKPGLVSDGLVERFRRERQTLARLGHPNIARLFDGGETDSGAPFIVMELVDGLPLLAWVDAHDPPRAMRLDLFRQTCDAVAAAHSHLIVHRDITPSNVLVTKDARVKLIDFGIARPVEQGAETGGHHPVSLAGMSLTPGFAAPERQRGGEVTTAADIFSLGRVLEQLLPDDRAPELRAIVARATATDPDARYGTVDALAADVAAWAEDRPVRAYAGDRFYPLRKLVARHRLAAVATIATSVLLIVALAVTGWSYVRAERARAAEAQRFAEVRSIAAYLLFDHDDRLRRVPGNTSAREALVARAQGYLDRLAESPIATRDVRMEAARGFLRLAVIQDSPLDPNLGMRDAAKVNLAKGRRLIARVRAEDGDGADLAAVAARADAMAAMIAFHQHSAPGAARALLDRATKTIDAVPAAARDAAWAAARRDVSRAMLEFLVVNEENAAVPAAVAAHRRLVDAWPAAMRRGDGVAVERAYADYQLGMMLAYREGRSGEAYDLLARAFGVFAAAERRRRDDPDLLFLMGWSGIEAYAAGARAGREEEAAPVLIATRVAARRLTDVADRDKSATVLLRNIDEAYAQHMANRGRFAEAIAAQRLVVASNARANGADPEGIYAANLGYNKMILGSIARDGGDRALACESWQQALAHFERARRDGQLIGFHAAFVPGLRRNAGLCGTGATLAAMPPLR